MDDAREARALELLPAALARVDELARLELPGTPPPFSPAAGIWAGTLFYQAGQFLVHREIGAEVVRKSLGKACPRGDDASRAYSVDLVFRYLPDLLSLARGIAHEDPLVERLTVLARQWPLSSAGVALPSGVDPSPFMKDRCLRILYAERIIASKDVSRLDRADVREAVREAIGLHPELSPEVAAALEKTRPERD